MIKDFRMKYFIIIYNKFLFTIRFLMIKFRRNLLLHNIGYAAVLLPILFIVSSYINSPTSKSETNPSGVMQVKGRFLYTAAGEKVILRGVNEMFIWSDNKTGEEILPEIARTGANSVRLVWTTEGDPLTLDILIRNCLQNQMIPIIELHDATGDWSKLPVVIDYWLREDVKKIIKKYERWALVNIANEVGQENTSDSLFVTTYKSAITKLRNAGYQMPLIIDASQWGQDEKIILRNWRELLKHDKLNNIMFSVHTYWTDPQAEERLDNLVSKVVRNSIPLLFGEGPQPYGWDCTTSFPYLHCIKKCKELEIGWLCWSWGAVRNGDCKNQGAFDMTRDGKFGNWNNDWGRLVAVDDPASIKNTSVRPKSLINEFK
jgi:mannan endo-1,4-beta-mannosidase